MSVLPDSGSEWSTFCSLYGGLVQWVAIPKRWWHSETCWQHWSRCAGEMIWTWIDSVSSSCMDCCLFVWGTTDTVCKLASWECSHPAAMAGSVAAPVLQFGTDRSLPTGLRCCIMSSRLIEPMVFSLCKVVGLFVSDSSNIVWKFFIWERRHL